MNASADYSVRLTCHLRPGPLLIGRMTQPQRLRNRATEARIRIIHFDLLKDPFFFTFNVKKVLIRRGASVAIRGDLSAPQRDQNGAD